MEVNVPHISKAQVKFIRSLQQKKVRDAEQLFVAEGDKCIGELMSAFELCFLVATAEQWSRQSPDSLPTVSRGSSVGLVATATEIEQMSSLRTPQGSIAVFRKPSISPTDGLTAEGGPTSNSPTDGLLLALDGIQDPGNLGTIIRTCDWFGIRDIYCSHETADCYNPKVVQATMGALARVRIHYVNLVQWLSSYNAASQSLPQGGGQEGTYIYGTLLDGKNMYNEGAIPDKSHGIIIMGNEGNGISSEVRAFITHPLYIPSYGTGVVESLNVSIATAITLSEFRRISQHQ